MARFLNNSGFVSCICVAKNKSHNLIGRGRSFGVLYFQKSVSVS